MLGGTVDHGLSADTALLLQPVHCSELCFNLSFPSPYPTVSLVEMLFFAALQRRCSWVPEMFQSAPQLGGRPTLQQTSPSLLFVRFPTFPILLTHSLP